VGRLRAEVLALKQERDRLAEQLVESQRNGAIVNIDLKATRESERRLRERVKAATSPLVKSIGQCSHCGERAPLMEGAKLPSRKLKLVCVYGWGCSSGEALTDDPPGQEGK
jgi:hypothetical protein